MSFPSQTAAKVKVNKLQNIIHFMGWNEIYFQSESTIPPIYDDCFGTNRKFISRTVTLHTLTPYFMLHVPYETNSFFSQSLLCKAILVFLALSTASDPKMLPVPIKYAYG